MWNGFLEEAGDCQGPLVHYQRVTQLIPSFPLLILIHSAFIIGDHYLLPKTSRSTSPFDNTPAPLTILQPQIQEYLRMKLLNASFFYFFVDYPCFSPSPTKYCYFTASFPMIFFQKPPLQCLISIYWAKGKLVLHIELLELFQMGFPSSIQIYHIKIQTKFSSSTSKYVPSSWSSCLCPLTEFPKLKSFTVQHHLASMLVYSTATMKTIYSKWLTHIIKIATHV